jgi:hypothetical protein
MANRPPLLRLQTYLPLPDGERLETLMRDRHQSCAEFLRQLCYRELETADLEAAERERAITLTEARP